MFVFAGLRRHVRGFDIRLKGVAIRYAKRDNLRSRRLAHRLLQTCALRFNGWNGCPHSEHWRNPIGRRSARRGVISCAMSFRRARSSPTWATRATVLKKIVACAALWFVRQ